MQILSSEGLALEVHSQREGRRQFSGLKEKVHLKRGVPFLFVINDNRPFWQEMGTDLTVKDLLTVLDRLAGFALAEKWDNVGLMVGNPEQRIQGILVALDPTGEVLVEAKECGADCIITHHPLIFNPLKTIYTNQPLGRFLQKALQSNTAVIGCHTNLDQAAGGVNDILAAGLGLVEIRPLVPVDSGREALHNPDTGFGRIGRFVEPMSREAFVARLCDYFNLPALRAAGKIPDPVNTAAVCGGSGSELAEAALAGGAQVFITGEVKHNTARWAEASDFCIIDAGHFPTENPVVAALVSTLDEIFSKEEIAVPVRASSRQQNPFAYHQPE